MLATLIADDLTGACDAGAVFAARGRVGVFWGETCPGSEWAVAALDTDSRHVGAAAASERVGLAARRLAGRLAGGLLFKKIDSTLRGHVGAELEALLRATGRRAALVCPAFPDQERTVVDGVLRVGREPVHLTAIGRDPAYPEGSSEVARIVSRGTARRVCVLSLAVVRGAAPDLARALARATEHIVVADAETDADLDRIAAAALTGPDLVLSGSAGLARAAARALGYADPAVPLPEGHAWLILAGSLHPATRAQLRALETVGVTGVRLDGSRDPDLARLRDHLAHGRPVFIATSDQPGGCPDVRQEAACRLGWVAARLLVGARPDLVVATGGATAAAFLRAIGAARLELLGAPSGGLALGDAVVPDAPPLPLLTKAGGFGSPDLFVSLLKGAA
jgi:D-threonate/D-erythronate kinase